MFIIYCQVEKFLNFMCYVIIILNGEIIPKRSRNQPEGAISNIRINTDRKR